MTRRTLSLKRETLAELTEGELSSVAGGATLVCPGDLSIKDGCPTQELAYCLTFAGSRCIY